MDKRAIEIKDMAERLEIVERAIFNVLEHDLQGMVLNLPASLMGVRTKIVLFNNNNRLDVCEAPEDVYEGKIVWVKEENRNF